MTIDTENYKTKSIGNGGLSYPYEFKIWAESQIRVIRSNKVAPLEKDEGELNVDFTVDSVGASAGGNITCIGDWASDPPDSSEYVTCIRNIPYKQPVDIENQGVPKGNTIEKLVDILTAVVLQLKEVVDRTVRVDEVSDEDADALTLESFAGSAPVDGSGWGGFLAGATPETVQGLLDWIDAYGAPLDSPALINDPTAPTQAEQDGSAKIATCAYADRAARILIAEDSGGGATLEVLAGAALFATYEALELEIVKVRAVSSGVQLRIQAYNQTLGAWHVEPDQIAMGLGVNEDNASFTWGAREQTYMKLTGDSPNDMGALTWDCASGLIRIFEKNTDSPFPAYHGSIAYGHHLGGYDTNYCACRIFGAIYHVATWGGFKIYFSSGNISEGKIRLWGLPKGS